MQVHLANQNKQQALHFACMSNPDATIIDSLLQAGADPNAVDCEGTSPFCFACRCGSVGLVDLLIASGAEVSGASSRDPLLRPRMPTRLCTQVCRCAQLTLPPHRNCRNQPSRCGRLTGEA